MIHHAQESSDTRSLVIHLQLQICHCKSCGTSCLSKTKPLYYILNQRSVTAPGAEHPGCLVTSVGLQMDFMASCVKTWTLTGNTDCLTWNTTINLITTVLITCWSCMFRASHPLLLINSADPQIHHEIRYSWGGHQGTWPQDLGRFRLCGLCRGVGSFFLNLKGLTASDGVKERKTKA